MTPVTIFLSLMKRDMRKWSARPWSSDDADRLAFGRMFMGKRVVDLMLIASHKRLCAEDLFLGDQQLRRGQTELIIAAAVIRSGTIDAVGLGTPDLF